MRSQGVDIVMLVPVGLGIECTWKSHSKQWHPLIQSNSMRSKRLGSSPSPPACLLLDSTSLCKVCFTLSDGKPKNEINLHTPLCRVRLLCKEILAPKCIN